MHVEDRGWEDLSVAIVLLAIEDWRKSKLKLAHLSGQTKKANEMVKSCEKFFTGGWFEILTGVEGSAFLRKLKGECAFKEAV